MKNLFKINRALVAKKKIFTLAAAVLASFSLLAATPTVEILNTNFTQWKEGATPPENTGLSNKSTYTLTDGTNDVASVVGSGCKLNDTKNTPTSTGITGYNTNKFRFGSKDNYLYITPTANFVDGGKVRILVSSEKTKESDILGTVQIGDNNLGSLHGWTAAATCDWQEFEIPETVDGTAQLKLTRTDNTMFVWGIQVLTNKDCTDPEASIIDDDDIFVGDAIDLEFTSSNTNAADTVVTLDGDEAIEDEDYEWVEDGFKPLAAGEFVITISQEADGTYCDVEESVTLTAYAKEKVTSFTIDGPTAARIGDEVTLRAKDFDAAPEAISWVLGGVEVSTTTSYTFTPSAAGSYVFTITAENQFNEDDAATVSHTVTVAVSTDATLSDLQVNGTTVAGFDAATLSYNIGEIGVYETLNITATAADAPYATVDVADDKAGKVTVTVTAEDESTKVYTISYTRAAATVLASISESTTWDWTKAGDIQASALSASTSPTNSEEINFADVLTNYDASFNAAALAGKVQWYNRKESNNVYAQGNYIKFNTTVAGTLVITFSGTNSTSRELRINSTKVAEYSDNKAQESSAINIAAGEVLIEAYEGENVSMARIYKIVFTKTDVPSALDNTDEEAKAVKRVVNGQLIIEKDGKLFNILGGRIR